MKVAVVGSRTLTVRNLGDFLPEGATEIVSGGANGIDSCARDYAKKNGLRLTEFYPDYSTYGKLAPLIRNIDIIKYADIVVAIWDGKSYGTSHVIQKCKEMDVAFNVFLMEK